MPICHGIIDNLQSPIKHRHYRERINESKTLTLTCIRGVYLAAILKRNVFFIYFFYLNNVNLFMFTYFEPNFIEIFFLESDFSNFGHVTVFAKWKLVYYIGRRFETVNVFGFVLFWFFVC